MDVQTLFGLPAHPLLVHLPVVLVPLAFVGALGLLWRPWLRRFGWATVVVLAVAGVATQLAIGSGQALEEHVRESALLEQHTEMGESIRPWLLLFFLALLAFMLLERRRRGTGTVAAGHGTSSRSGAWITDPVLVVLFAATVLLGGVAVYWVQRIGHSGAKATWEDTQRRIDRGGGAQGEQGEQGGEHDG